MILPSASRGIDMAHLCEIPGTDPPEYIDGVTSLADCDAEGGNNYMLTVRCLCLQSCLATTACLQ